MAELAEPLTAPSPGRLGIALRAVVGWFARAEADVAVRRFFYVLLVLYVAKAAVFIVAFPPFTGHDEVAHYSYLRTVAVDHRVPVLLEDRLPPELYRYSRYSLQWQGNGEENGPQYAANHPPLYYIMMTPLYWVSEGGSPVTQQYLLRMAAVPFGLIVVWLAFLMARALFPGDAFLGIGVPAFVAFQPQISYEAAMVNNDIICIALFSLILYLLVRGIRDRFPVRICILTGFALGLALLSKGTALTAAPIIAFAVILGIGWRPARAWIWRGALILAPAAVLTAPWYVFLYRTYGNFDALEQVEQLQAAWNRPEGDFFDLLFMRSFASLRFKETWGEFGWRLIHLDTFMLWAIGLPLIVAVGGLVQYALSAGHAETGRDDPVMRPVRWQAQALLMLLFACVIAYLAVVQFGTRFMLTQARYYFPAVNAAALLLVLGWRTLIPRRWHGYGQALVFSALVFLNLMIFTQYVIPFWYLN